eukprot:TRINITY_DN5667_c0_g1_i4.p1 TRINITY_DN5667_c0_g1~~TRINITY_DN5667_c0_g1_i4.p1  ORF type:complete len:197 (+),score=39.66 TRINITY_DN5667_c0_g1_i4:187-777(+)
MQISELKQNEINFFTQNDHFFQQNSFAEFDLDSFKKQLEQNSFQKVNQTFEEFAKQQQELEKSYEKDQQFQVESLEQYQAQVDSNLMENNFKNIKDMPVAQSILINEQQQKEQEFASQHIQMDNPIVKSSSSSESSSSKEQEDQESENNSNSSNEIIYQLDEEGHLIDENGEYILCLLYTSPSPRDRQKSRMPSSA